ncbi:MAG: cation transporter [Coriobacteriia bacterium]|nr:MAG: cation transporter [Coriobacteriia bacterium]
MTADANNPKLDEDKVIRKLSLVGIVGNVFLSAFKFFAGIIGNSSAMVSDAVHSLSDVFATFIAFLGVKFGRRAADASHPYGHERIESLAAIALGLILLVTGIGIGWVGLEKIIAGNYESLPIPGMIALIAAIVSIAVKEGMFWYTRHWARAIRSSAFEADAWHHRSDAMSSVGALIGVGGSMLGYPVLDPIASVVICLFILKQGISIIYDALKKMIDTSCGPQFEKEIRGLVDSEDQVERIDVLRTRMFGDKVYVDMEIAIDGSMQLTDAHAIAERVHDDIEHAFPEVKHVMIHVNPA